MIDISQKIEKKEKEIMEKIGEEVLIGDTLISLRGMPILAIERLPELYPFYIDCEHRKKQETKPFTPEAIQRQLQKMGLETIAKGTPLILSEEKENCTCNYHQIANYYNRAIDPKARLAFNFGLFYVAGFAVGLQTDLRNQNEEGKIYTLVTTKE